MVKIIAIITFFLAFKSENYQALEKQDYSLYHKKVIVAEKLIATENYKGALGIYEELFKNYDFIFLREYQIATQLALHGENQQKAMQILKRGITSGWKLKSIKRNRFIIKLLDKNNWKTIKKNHSTLQNNYTSNLNNELRDQVKRMFRKDQKKAFQALFRFSSKGQDRFAENKFAPHSEEQMSTLSKILKTHGYPGENLIGNDFWMSTIISHHNSISQEYVKQDTLYPSLKSELLKAIKKGQMSPFEFAMIDDWYHSVLDKSIYGILNLPLKSELPSVNKKRETIFIRPIETRNKLVDIENKTGMNLYLQGGAWIKGKIVIKN